jgi:hypothetical protein
VSAQIPPSRYSPSLVLTCCHLFRACQQSSGLGLFGRIYPEDKAVPKSSSFGSASNGPPCRVSGIREGILFEKTRRKIFLAPMQAISTEFNELSHYAAPSKIFPSLSMLTMMRRPSRKIIFSRSKLLRYSVTCWREAPTDASVR